MRTVRSCLDWRDNESAPTPDLPIRRRVSSVIMGTGAARRWEPPDIDQLYPHQRRWLPISRRHCVLR
jgi:hypothetical protein